MPHSRPVPPESSRPPAPHPVRVVLTDDHPTVREGIRTVLEHDPDIAVVGVAANLAQTRRAVERLRPHVLMLDQQLPDGQGIAACPSLLRIDRRLRIVIVTQFASADLARCAVAAGARGYLVKRSDPDALRTAVHTVVAGHRYTDARVGTDYGLSVQELRVLALLAEGMTNARIAGHLGISAETVKSHVRRVIAKLGASNRTDAAVIAVARGLAPRHD